MASWPAAVSADTFSWTGGDATTPSFAAPANWAGAAAPPGDGSADLHFGAAAGNGLTPTASAAYAVDSLTFDAGAAPYTLTGSPLTLGAGGITDAAAGTETIANPVPFAAPQNWTLGPAAGTLNLTGGATINGYNLTVNVAGTSTLAGNFAQGSNPGQLTKTGLGTLTLAGAVLSAMGLTVTAGTVVYGPAVTNVPHTSSNLIVGSPTADAAQFQIIGGTLNSNLFEVGNGGTRGTVVQSAGIVSVGSSVVLGNALGPTLAGSVSAYTLSGGVLNTYETIVGNVGIGTFEQAGGTHNVNTVSIGANGSGTYNLAGGTLSAEGVGGATYNPAYTGTSTFNFDGGTFQASPNADSTYFGSLSSAVVRVGGAVLDTNGKAIMIAQPLAHDPAPGAAAIDGGLSKIGTGTLTLSSPDTYTGRTTVAAGTLVLADGGALQDSTLALVRGGGNVAFSSGVAGKAFVVGGLSGNGDLPLVNNASTPAAVSVAVGGDNASTTYAGSLSGAGSLAKQGGGTLVLTGTNTYGGPTTVSAGTLTVGTTASLPGGTAVTVAAGATLALATRAAGGAEVVPTVAALNLASAAGSALGRVDVADGAIVVRGSTLAVVSAEAAAGYANGTFNGAGGITSSAAAADVTHLTAVGVIANTDPSTGQPLYGAGATLGLFDGVDARSGDVLVKYTYDGDANLDGVVDGRDYVRIDAGYASGGTLTGWYNGDFNYDGRVDGSDYTLTDNAYDLRRGSFSGAAVATAEVAAVPEPTAVALVAAAVACGFVGRVHNRRRAGRNCEMPAFEYEPVF